MEKDYLIKLDLTSFKMGRDPFRARDPFWGIRKLLIKSHFLIMIQLMRGYKIIARAS